MGLCGHRDRAAFGFEAGHLEVSRQVGERVLLPAVREASPDTFVVADGFSCREQIVQETGRRTWHLADVLQAAAGAGREEERSRRRGPGLREMTILTGGVLAAVTAGAGVGRVLDWITERRV